MESRLLFGLNVLEELLKYGFEEKKCDELRLASFNVNLDLAFNLIETYPHLQKIVIYSNTEHIYYDRSNKKRIEELFKEEQIQIYHISENKHPIHAKIYQFCRENEIIFQCLGSSNFSFNTNQNFECLYIIDPDDDSRDLVKNFEEITSEFNMKEDYEPIFRRTDTRILECNESLDDLWEHQKAIIKWLQFRNRAIINIPPGTGKSKIGLEYLKMISNNVLNPCIIILVPTSALLIQWKQILLSQDYNVVIGGTRNEDYIDFVSNPEDQVLLTLYSRFANNKEYIAQHLHILNIETLVLLADECHNVYSKIKEITSFPNSSLRLENYFHLGLSATIDTFNRHQKWTYIDYCGGNDNIYEISLNSFYAIWNKRNVRPILKNIDYRPIFYFLTEDEESEYNKFTQSVMIEHNRQRIENLDYNASLKRAQFVKSLSNSMDELKNGIEQNFSLLNEGNTIIFVSTHDFAEEMREFIVSHTQWNPDNSAFIYDSRQNETFRKRAMEQFQNNRGYCLISEYMLAEGFDLPKISCIVLHGSHKSKRDWIQKIGRAIRYDIDDPDSKAIIIDLVFCNQKGVPLTIDKYRYKVLKSLSHN